MIGRGLGRDRSGRVEHVAAFPGQVRHRHDVARLGRIGVLVGPPRLLREPPGERLAAAVVGRRRLLPLAAGRTRLAADAHVEMVVMAPERPDLAQPVPVARDRVAELLLDAGVDQDAFDLRVARRPLQQARVRRRPQRVLHQMRLLVDHQRGAHALALRPRQGAVGHRRQPDIGIEPDLVRGMPGQHRAAARLRDIADQEARPAVGDGIARQFLDRRDHRRMTPAAVARRAHHLPGRSIHGNGDTAGKATLGVEAEGLRRGRGRQFLGTEQVLGAFLGQCWLRA